MYVCICNCVTDRQIREAARNGVSGLEELQSQLQVATGCGKCAPYAMEVLREARATHAAPCAGLGVGAVDHVLA